MLFVKSNGKLAISMKNTTTASYDGTGSHTLSTGTWYYLVATYSSSTGTIGYVNAASDATVAGATALASGTANTYIGSDQNDASGRYWNGTIDEARVASTARSADWITTEYNNQNAPGSFYTVGTEVSLVVSNQGFFIFFP
jgi:hypothetical protein